MREVQRDLLGQNYPFQATSIHILLIRMIMQQRLL